MTKTRFLAPRRDVILRLAAFTLAAAVTLAASNLYAQMSFGKMRDASEKGNPAPTLDDEDDAAFNVDPKKPAASKSSGKSSSGKTASASKTNVKPSSKTTAKDSAQTAPKVVEPEEVAADDVNASETSPAENTPAPKNPPATGRATAGRRANSPNNTTQRPAGSNSAAARQAANRRPAQSASNAASESESETTASVSGKPVGENGHGPLLGRAVSHKYRAGMIFQAQPGGTCVDVFGSAPVPTEFPEQKVRMLEEDFPKIAKVDYRNLKEGGARQLVFKMRELRGGQGVEASALFEVTRYPIMPPADTSIYSIPKSVPTDIRRYLKESKYMESSTKTIKSLAKEAAADCKTDWEKVDNILSFVRDNIQYKEALIEKPMRGALAALRSREGDCEDQSALFISMCRALDIPARLVRVPGHCWAEFYLVDDEKQGFWFPANLASTSGLGYLEDTRVILQKGDAFHLPESPKEEDLYVKELFMGTVKDNGPDPKYQFIQETDGE